MKIVCKQPNMAKLPYRQQKSLTYHFKIDRLSLKINGNNIVYIRLLIQWYRYPALNSFQKAKSIQYSVLYQSDYE